MGMQVRIVGLPRARAETLVAVEVLIAAAADCDLTRYAKSRGSA